MPHKPFLHFLAPFSELLLKLNTPTSDNLPVTCIISDGIMPFSFTAAQELRIPAVMLFTISVCSLMGFMQLATLRDKGLTPFKGDQEGSTALKSCSTSSETTSTCKYLQTKDIICFCNESYLTNGYLDTVIDWIPGMRDIRLRDLPAFIRKIDPTDIIFNFAIEMVEKAHKASGVVIHTFDALEREVLEALSPMFPHLYAIGPLQLLLNQSLDYPLKSIGYGLWTEDMNASIGLTLKPPTQKSM
ncbi:UDP-glycosyltransferase 85A7 [Morella rubra]|uniref:UDP-glycosyltransferase 85A7 n=1 Tax=Morella rubra TaxID=262757 RepID=A0A6A1W5Z0_9ROSI|nr:UDP-glycosyltransferase 85A7 [Morella rubra]